MLPRWNRLWALLCLLLVIQLASAELRIVARQDKGSSTDVASATTGGDASKTTDNSEKTTDKATDKSSDKSVAATTTTTKQKESKTQATASSTVIQSDGTLDNSTFVNATIPAGQLPLEPVITPGWGVAGVIMLLTGVAHTLIGIKNQWIHTFFSTAYSGSLGIAVLIVYVMKVPVSNALQGGYVVAVVISGCGLGAASLFFRELLEVLGCALGGFCVSMWLMCLVNNGLLVAVVSRAIFIASFTLAGFAFYFSQYTRDWALILMISFTGATVTVLGIDCFSRAGLKEFWAWIWQLNDDLFPLGADGYPVTKGIRVETAAIFIIFMIGVISQIKLWKIVREQREKQAQEIAEGQRNLQQEEENVGRNIEEANARERREWERVYGNGDAASTIVSHASENAEVNEKQMRTSHTESQRQSVEVIEMTDMTDSEQQPRPPATNLMATALDKDGVVTVRVAADEAPNSPTARDVNEKATVAASDDQTSTFVGGEEDRRASRAVRVSQSTAPEVVPLPFVVPPPEDDEPRSEGNRSSVATFADDEDIQPNNAGNRNSLAKRLSHLSRGSAELLRTLSHRSRSAQDEVPPGENGSLEDLVIPTHRPRDDEGSVAATIDDESISAGDRRSLPLSELQKNIEITAELSDRGPLTPAFSEKAKAQQDGDGKSPTNLSPADGLGERASEGQDKAKSASSAASARVSLTKDRLPKPMSRVALSYRTNEWAKHLSKADTPEPDQLHIQEPQVAETAAPVHVEDLKKASDEGTPSPAPINRSDSYHSHMSYGGSRQNVPAALAILNGDGQNRSPGSTPTSANMPRSASAMQRRTSGGAFHPIAEEANEARKGSTSPPPQISDGARSSTPGLVSYSSPQTLIGQREMFLRNKSQGNLLATSSELNLHRTSSDAGSLNNYPMYAAAMTTDVDDVPLNQRKQMMRQSSLNPSASTPSLGRLMKGQDAGADSGFDSHQPQRISTVPTPAAREAALLNFRQAVANDLRAPPVVNTGRETPFAPMSLLGGGREAEVQRNIEMGRNILMGQKEAEAQRRERELRQKEWADRAFDERMRSGDLLGAHREAMRKMQKNAKDR